MCNLYRIHHPHNRHSLWHHFIFILFLCLAQLLSTPSSLAGKPPVYSFGVVPQFEIRKVHDTWSPILREVEKRTGLKFKLHGTKSITEFEKQFQTGMFDFAYMNPYHLIMAHKAQGYQPILRDHSKQLQGILVVANNGKITDLGQLSHKTIAFPSPNALGASLMIRAELHDQFGLTIKPRYVKTHDSVYLNTVLGQTDAGGGIEKTLTSQKREIRDRLKVLLRTHKVNAHPIAAHSRIPEEVRQAVADAFIAISKSAGGKIMLSDVPIGEIGSAQLNDYTDLNAMHLERFYQPNP